MPWGVSAMPMMRGDHLPGLSGPRHVHTRVPSDFLWMRVRVCAQVLRDRRGPGARFAEHEGLGGAGPGLGKRFGAALRRRRIWDLWPTLRATLVLRQYVDRRRRAVLLPCAASDACTCYYQRQRAAPVPRARALHGQFCGFCPRPSASCVFCRRQRPAC